MHPIDSITFNANSTAEISDTFVSASDNNSLTLNHGTYSLNLDLSDISSNNEVIVNGTGQITLTDQGVISSADGVNTNIIGSNLADTFISGSGNDTYTGGTGADIFKYDQSSSGFDTITDFTGGEDKIDIADLFAGNATFTGQGGTFSGTIGEVIWNDVNGSTTISIDTTGSGSADVEITLDSFSASNLDQDDFIDQH